MYSDFSARIFLIASALFFLHAVAVSQTPASDDKPRASSISGRVTIGANPAVKKRVVIREIKLNYGNSGSYLQGDESRSGKVFIGVTDADGKYRVTGLTAGEYMVSVEILGSYAADSQSGRRSKQLQLGEEEERTNIDFALVRGGVITGRVTDPDGKPIIEGFVDVSRADETGNYVNFGSRANQTDDRGIYRIYGLPAGRYHVSASATGKSGRKYGATFHPDVTDEKQAAVIEVKEGGESSDIDIRLNIRKKEGFDVAGRVIDSQTGEPVSLAVIYCSGVGPTRARFSAESVDSQGSFRLSDLAPGQYVLQVRPGYNNSDQQQFYSEQTTIEVTQGDVSGVEIRAKRGGAIRGVVIFDESHYPALKARMSQTLITGNCHSKDDALIKRSYGGKSVKVMSDGSFLLEGLAPEIVSFEVRSSVGARPPLLLRVERDGVAIPNKIELSSGATITGIRLVLTDKTGTIRGQINFTGARLPEGVRLTASAYQDKDPSYHLYNGTVVVDKKGRFVIEGLMDGEYMVSLTKGPEDGSSGSFVGSQRVQVVRGAETQVTFTLDLDEERRKNER